MTKPQEIRCHGVGVSEGHVVGHVLRMHSGTRYIYRATLDERDLQRELRRFHDGVEAARHQLTGIKQRAEKEFGKDHAYIFDAHLLLLEDRKLIGEVENLITTQRVNAEWALKVVCDQWLAVFDEIKDDYLREKGSDIEDVVQRILVALSGEPLVAPNLSQDMVIVSEELLPSTMAELDADHIRAVVTDSGGWTSHMAIIARGLGIPAVVGLRDFYRRAATGDEIAVDANRNCVILHPSSETLEQYRTNEKSFRREPTEELESESAPVRTVDGVEILLRANVELPSEFEEVRRYRAHGVGLYRSEFLLARRSVMVSEDEQYQAYAQIAELAGDAGAIVRLFDLGGENRSELTQEPERNPALGLRAIRYGLVHEQIMRRQIRAILRAASRGKIAVVLPMVGDVSDVRRARKIIDEERMALQSAGVIHGPLSVGAMIEIPSAVITADKIASLVDFFELGTNDLVQYTLAVDRGNESAADWFRTLHPAVLYSIDHSVRVAGEAKIPVIVCGEMASTPAYAVLLIGLGAVDLSMTPSLIPRIRKVLSQIDSGDARAIAVDCLRCENADQVEEIVRERFKSRWPDLFPLSSLPRSSAKAD